MDPSIAAGASDPGESAAPSGDAVRSALRRCTGPCKRLLPLEHFVNKKDPTKYTQRCDQCRDAQAKGHSRTQQMLAGVKSLAKRDLKDASFSSPEKQPPRKKIPPLSDIFIPPPIAPAPERQPFIPPGPRDPPIPREATGYRPLAPLAPAPNLADVVRETEARRAHQAAVARANAPIPREATRYRPLAPLAPAPNLADIVREIEARRVAQAAVARANAPIPREATRYRPLAPLAPAPNLADVVRETEARRAAQAAVARANAPTPQQSTGYRPILPAPDLAASESVRNPTLSPDAQEDQALLARLRSLRDPNRPRPTTEQREFQQAQLRNTIARLQAEPTPPRPVGPGSRLGSVLRRTTRSVSTFLPRGRDSQDSEETAIARKEQDVIRRDHRHRARAGETVSSTPSIGQLKRGVTAASQPDNDPLDYFICEICNIASRLNLRADTDDGDVCIYCLEADRYDEIGVDDLRVCLNCLREHLTDRFMDHDGEVGYICMDCQDYFQQQQQQQQSQQSSERSIAPSSSIPLSPSPYVPVQPAARRRGPAPAIPGFRNDPSVLTRLDPDFEGNLNATAVSPED